MHLFPPNLEAWEVDLDSFSNYLGTYLPYLLHYQYSKLLVAPEMSQSGSLQSGSQLKCGMGDSSTSLPPSIETNLATYLATLFTRGCWNCMFGCETRGSGN